MSLWYYAKDNQQHGPVELGALRRLAADGGLSASDLVWNESLPDWRAAGEVAGLLDPPSSPPPPRAVPAVGTSKASPGAPGYQPPLANRQSLGPSQQGLAITALVLGCASFMGFGPILGIPGLICGKIALSRMREVNNYEGQGMAQAGVVIGYIWCGIIAVVVVLLLLFFLFVAGVAVHH